MAILGEIRKKTWLLIIVIGVAMVAFVAGDLFSENSVLRTAFTGDPNVMGTVNGDDITYPDYNSAQQIVRNKAQNQGMNLPENMISQEAWNMALSKKLFAAHAEKTGMVVTDDDVWNYLAASAGFPSGNEFKQLIEEERKNGNPNVEAFFANFEENRSQLLAQKYIDLVSSAAVSTNIEAAFHQQSNIQTAEIEYGFANYENLKTNFKIEVTDEEISQYIKKHPKHFKREALVDLSYVYFSAQPSEADFSKAKEDLSKFLTKHVVVDEINNISDTIESFAGTANDSIYISKYSDQPFMSYFFTKEEIEKSGATQEIKSFLNSASVGQVGGPFKQENSYQLLKISKVKPVNDSVNSSHILISFEGSQASQRNPNITRTKEQAKVLADSLLAAVKKNPSAFNELATEKSDDLGSKSQNGNVGWVSKSSQNMAFTYLNYITNHTKGSIGLVESEFGYHIIRIDDTKVKTGYQIAILLKEVNASQKTTDDIFENATSFAQEISGKSLNDFVNEAIKKGYNYGTSESLERFAPRIITEDRNIGGDQDDAILKWAFDKKNKVGSSYLFPATINGDRIIVYLKAKYDKGLASPNTVRDFVEPILAGEKLSKLAQEKLGANTSIENLIKEFGGEQGSKTVSFSNSSIEGLGYEPKVVGAAFGLKEGQTSKVIAGSSGLFVVKTISKTPLPEVSNPEFLIPNLDYTQKQKLSYQSLLYSMISSAEIKDNRAKNLR